MAEGAGKLEARVVRAAEAALAEKHYVSPIDVLVGVGWLTPPAVERWRQGRVEDLERVAQANLHKLSEAMRILRQWATAEGLHASETAYVARTRDHRPLRFSRTGTPAIEAAYRTHWVSPELSEARRTRMAERQSRAPDLVVVEPLGDWTCSSCSRTGDPLIMEDPGPVCLACADLDHLVFLPAGDAALTRRAKKASGLSAVVVRFSRSRGRYERRGVLVEEEARVFAEQACLADEEARLRRRGRDEQRRAEQDVAFQAQFARAVTTLFPGCPPERAESIARRAGTRSSGRVGRSAAGRALDPNAVTLAVVASVRHLDTPYDRLLMSGTPRREARDAVREKVAAVIDGWRSQAPAEVRAEV